MIYRKTEVEATFMPDGWPVPKSLTWYDVRLAVKEMGRRWKEDDGIHLLVRVADGRVFELHTNGSLWQAALISDPPHTA
jgi:hypothetical protein